MNDDRTYIHIYIYNILHTQLNKVEG